MNYTKTILLVVNIAIGLSLTSCFDSALNELRVQAITGHLISIPATSDTTQAFQLSSDSWASDWETVLSEAGVSEGQVKEARPLAAQISLVNPADSTFRKFTQISFAIAHEGTETLLAELPENTVITGKSGVLFAANTNHREAFFGNAPQIVLDYQRNYPTDSLWTIELLVLWELVGE